MNGGFWDREPCHATSDYIRRIAGILPAWGGTVVSAPVADTGPMGHLDEVIGHLRYVTTVYGSGWVDADGAIRETPEPFRIGYLHPPSNEGMVLGGHEFTGATARLSPRHAAVDGIWNVEIKRDDVIVAQGYAIT